MSATQRIEESPNVGGRYRFEHLALRTVLRDLGVWLRPAEMANRIVYFDIQP